MARVNEKSVLDFYINEINEDSITFLKGKRSFKAKIKEDVEKLSKVENMNDKIEVSKKLWKLLFEAAMSYIDPDKRGYDELFKYFDEYVEFEELIFASDSFYRDHTVHCLWVYFLGEYITKTKEYGFLFKNFNNNMKIIKAFKEVLELGLTNNNKGFEYALNEIVKTEKYQDSIYCISALTHDLGYPLKKINKINKSISRILPYFSINNFNEFKYNFDDIQKSNIDSFIEMLTDDMTFDIRGRDSSDELENILSKIFTVVKGNIVSVNKEGIKKLSDEEKNKLSSCAQVHVMLRRARSSYITYCNDFEEYRHGIMSAFLLTRVLKSFTSSKIVYASKADLNINDVDFADVSAKRDILSSISDHTSSGYRIRDITSTSEVLTFVDELEEFSRISRANQSRQYISEFCKTDIYVEDGVFNIDFIFDNEELDNLDPEKAFKGRCRRFLT
ncbi:MAG: hypothetical protein LIR50_12915, partial [Bacillota bacterium]|nr:hypothetical protein [Bacillota bacterium]